MAFLQLATEVSQPFVIEGVSPITPTNSRKNSTPVNSTDLSANEQQQQQTRQRHNSLSLL